MMECKVYLKCLVPHADAHSRPHESHDRATGSVYETHKKQPVVIIEEEINYVFFFISSRKSLCGYHKG